GSEAFIRQDTASGIRVSIGHSDATAAMVHLAGDWGADHITHTFNAQTPVHHREPGVPGAALADNRFYCEMICDGKHLHEDIIRMIILCKGAGHAVAITDAMEAAGMPDGEYSLGGQAVYVRDGAARLKDGTLAGSILTMPQALSNLIHRYRTDPLDACAMCISTPAESIGENIAGHMVPGSPGVLTRWSSEWEMKSVITENGEVAN
ncbi:MAG: N-acetylglucosamine-6-phosphate deacetylase, partial [Clostridia bacterium]|nr:N-acetylglucosamine-6-phosphate deacetylase [Clostridia bacterium]